MSGAKLNTKSSNLSETMPEPMPEPMPETMPETASDTVSDTVPSWSIRDLASEFDITPRTLRFYEEKGLLNPARDRHNRRYSAADRTRLRLILRGKRLGLTLDESNDIIAMYDPASGNQAQLQKLIDKIRDKREQLQRQQRDLRALLKDLGEAEQRAQDALENQNL